MVGGQQGAAGAGLVSRLSKTDTGGPPSAPHTTGNHTTTTGDQAPHTTEPHHHHTRSTHHSTQPHHTRHQRNQTSTRHSHTTPPHTAAHDPPLKHSVRCSIGMVSRQERARVLALQYSVQVAGWALAVCHASLKRRRSALHGLEVVCILNILLAYH